MASIRNSRNLALLATIPRMIPYLIDPALIPGYKAIILTSPSIQFKVDDGGVATPTSIVITAQMRGLSGTPTWSVTGGTATLAPSGNTCTLTYASMMTDFVEIQAQYAEGLDTYTAKTSISKVYNGPAGGAGPSGQSNFRIYRAFPFGSPGATPGNTTNGATPSGWSSNPVSITTNEAQYQSDGTQASGSTVTTWSAPYLSYFKVGELSAAAVNTGGLNVTGNLVVGASGSLQGGKISYSSSTSGFWIGQDSGYYRFHIGDAFNYLRYTGTTLEIRGDITGVSNIDITGSVYLAGSSTAGGFNAVAHIVNAAGANMGLRVTGNGGEGIFATTNKTDGVGAAIRGLANSFGVGVKGEATSSGVAVRAENSGGIGLDVIGTIRWSGYNIPILNGDASQVFSRAGTWVSNGVGFTPVEQGGGSGMLSNKIRIGWNGGQLAVQVDASSFGATWPISISGYAATAGNATTLNGYTAIELATEVYNSIDGDPNYIRKGPTYTISIPSLGGAWSCTFS